MNKKQTPDAKRCIVRCSGIQNRTSPALVRPIWLALMAVLFLQFGLENNAQAQTVGTVAQPVRVTIPINSGLTNDLGFTTTLSGTINPEHLALSSLPAGVDYLFSTNDFVSTASGTLTLFTTNVAEGVAGFSLDETGDATGNLLLTIQSAHLWSGATFTNGGTADFSDPGNWVGGTVAGPGADVVLTDSGGVGAGVATTNIVISADTEIGSLRQAITASATRRDNVQINDGVTFFITGTNGVSLGLRDRSDTYQTWEMGFTGMGGTLLMSNQVADFDTFAIENQTPFIYMNALGTFEAHLHQIHLCDYTAYPNWQNLQANGYNNAALPRRLPVPQFYWARTNLIYLNFPGDPNDWNDPSTHQYSMMVGNDNYISGSTQRHPFYFGISNLFEMNSVCFAGSGVAMDSGGAAKFNPAFAASNCVAIFRGTNGMSDRMAMFAISDNAGIGASGSASKAVIDFSAGTIDALVDRLYISRDRTNSSGGTASGTLTIGAGTFDVNTAILGYQSLSNNLGTGADYCQATLDVVSNGLFKVNNSLALGYTTAAGGSIGSAESGYGQVNISSGGTVEANTITVGGVTQVSGNNSITLNDGNLIVSNTVASATKRLATLSFANNSSLTLFVDGTATQPYVYATNLTTVGNNTINIAAVANITSTPIPLIGYVTPGAAFSSVTMPSGLIGVLTDDGTTIYLNVLTNTPKNLVWRGYVNGNWDTTTANWLDEDTGLQTNFVQGDNVRFDDTPGVPLTITTGSGSLILGTMTVTNTANAYVFTGTANLIGTAVKQGSNNLEIDNPTSLNLEVDNGSLTGSGTLKQVTVLAGAEMNYTGNVNGSIVCAGTGTISGSVVGALTLQSGGVFTNRGTFNNSFATADGSLLVNEVGAKFNNFGTCTIVSNAVVINHGYLGDQASTAGLSITVDNGGTFEDTGEGWITMDGALTIASGGTFIPGGDGAGTTYIYKGSVTSGYPARVVMSQGSTNVFKVNKDLGQNTQLQADYVDYGGSAKVKSFNGGTLLFENIGTTPFAPGDTFTIARYSETGGAFTAFSGTATNTYPVMDPAAPGFGLAWNINGITTSGIVNISGVATDPTNLVFNVSQSGANLITQLSWPQDYTGWRLQEQQDTLAVGLGTNWVDVFGSQWTNSVTVTNSVNAGSGFFRMVYP